MHPYLWTLRFLVEAHQGEMLEHGIHGNIPAYPNSGKTFGFLKNLSERDEPGTLLQPNRELREEIKRVAEEELNLDVLDLPSFPHDSPLMDEDSQHFNQTVVDWYERGMPPREIYQRVEAPEDDDYQRKLDMDWPLKDLLLGDPVHSFLDRVNVGRHVAFDDIDFYQSFVSKYEFGDNQQAKEIREYIEHHAPSLEQKQMAAGIEDEPLPTSVSMLLNASQEMKDLIHDHTKKNPSWKDIPATTHVTATASRFIHVITAKAAWQHHVEWTETDPCISEGIKVMGVFVPEDDVALIGQLPKNLRQAETVLAMSATPIYPVLRKFFGDLNLPAATVDPLPNEAKEMYFEEYLNMRIFQTTSFLRPASGDNSVPLDRLIDLIYAYIYSDKTTGYPLIISSKKFLDRVAPILKKEFDWFTDEHYIHFAKAIGTNKFDEITDCIVFGCPHYGDDYVRQMAAFCGDRDAEPIRKRNVPTKWSTDVSQEIYSNMTAGSVFQALMRVGRSTSDRTNVWIESSAIPEYVPRTKIDVHALTDTEVNIMEELIDSQKTVPQVYETLDVAWTTAYSAMKRLKELGLVAVADTGKHDADIWEIVIDIAGRDDLPKAIAELVNDIYIQADNSFERIEAEIEDPDPVLTMAAGIEPPRVDKSAIKQRVEEKGGQPIWAYVDHADEYDEAIPAPDEHRDIPDLVQQKLTEDQD